MQSQSTLTKLEVVPNAVWVLRAGILEAAPGQSAKFSTIWEPVTL